MPRSLPAAKSLSVTPLAADSSNAAELALLNLALALRRDARRRGLAAVLDTLTDAEQVGERRIERQPAASALLRLRRWFGHLLHGAMRLSRLLLHGASRFRRPRLCSLPARRFRTVLFGFDGGDQLGDRRLKSAR